MDDLLSPNQSPDVEVLMRIDSDIRMCPPERNTACEGGGSAGASLVGSNPGGSELRTATLADYGFVNHLQRKFGHALGFLPRMAIEANLGASNVKIAIENGEPAGYILGRPKLSWRPEIAPIYQAAVCMDAQRRHHGLSLLQQFREDALRRGQICLQANCAVGVEANEFWLAAGFKPICHMTPATKRGREIICWRLPLVRDLPTWFIHPPRRSGHLARLTKSVRNPQRSNATLDIARRFISSHKTDSTLPLRTASEARKA